MKVRDLRCNDFRNSAFRAEGEVESLPKREEIGLRGEYLGRMQGTGSHILGGNMRIGSFL